jgi:hypothetical protein
MTARTSLSAGLIPSREFATIAPSVDYVILAHDEAHARRLAEGAPNFTINEPTGPRTLRPGEYRIEVVR